MDPSTHQSVNAIPFQEDPSVDIPLPLPHYPRAHEPTFTWGIQGYPSFRHSVTCCYAEVVHWKRNLFKVPSGKIGVFFIKEVTLFIKAYTESSALESVARSEGINDYATPTPPKVTSYFQD